MAGVNHCRQGYGVELIKQRSLRDCAVCVAAMLTGTSYESVLDDNPKYENLTDQMWIAYVQSLGLRVRRTRLVVPGHRYFCIARKKADGDPKNSHAIAIDEQRRVFDPSTQAPDPGVLPVEWYKSEPRQLVYVHSVDPEV